ncbi:MAG TPA: Lrp/AsnC family transcriptional regulator [Mycobacteriales bacterium]|jgi:DNA-binding Lrp family transcriptional regulator|nr:Lrp/AsnC family transcriptional regulator [Mycobacteriales bacterium]
MPTVDALDDALLSLLAAEPRVGMLEASRRLGVARGTVQARLDKLERSGVVRSYGPELDAAALGYRVTAFATLEIRQGRGHGVVADQLRTIPEVIEAHTITGSGDLLCRLVARSNADLQRVIDQMVAGEPGDVLRVSTVIVLATEIPARTLPLLHAAAAG